MYSLPEPPYFLLVFGLFVGISCGLAFEASLKQKVREWSQSRSTQTIARLGELQLLLPFLGICVGICVFLAAGLEIFTMARKLSYAIALPMTVFTGYLIWSQLAKLLLQLERGGSRAIDLDALE
ncbi:MAG: hypothetical protein BRC40_03780 [Cyanobacteria bacterium QH_8_48_120]|jgi:hypothetical protein|nr:MAG: hypothetical protein BRC34_01770 [Cyanobacteria bacterium QH_1_48_107]PSO59466.1 MAG: hypothetical protein BRC35_03890 [Cyanobacteria bacterium QH_10_48_56]PSO61666.1 MAG: hypothetical protein BRC38_17590 [Cyanobacteria bacterium QH_6_48_35]PSO66688.1 MAG: hypothetical protein BRC36_00435 [Cyanobacteria bacterium QH_2_48_84]PSO67008.1 MAG: hypothetical protein BRC39_02185 [Cyanobacteria bacterium QH_7_48_89]PSO72103.1 MAG: hypothetical protein BRC37_12415 [Cyanobacteria bacterium QH_3_